MVVFEFLEFVLGFIAEQLELHGLKIGALAVFLGVAWYAREASDLFIVLARWTRTGSVLVLAIGTLLVVGLMTGFLSLSGGLGGVLDAILGAVNGVIH